jgi:hypothetical protein
MNALKHLIVLKSLLLILSSSAAGEHVKPLAPKQNSNVASDRWAQGLMPCEPKGAKSKITVAMDFHDHPKCLADREAERKQAKSGNALVILESRYTSFHEEGFYGSEDEVFHQVALLDGALGAGPLAADPRTPKSLRNHSIQIIALALAELSVSPSYEQALKQTATPMPEFIQKLGEKAGPEMSKANQLVDPKEKEKAVEASFGPFFEVVNEFYPKTSIPDTMFSFDKSIASAMETYREFLPGYAKRAGVDLPKELLSSMRQVAEVDGRDKGETAQTWLKAAADVRTMTTSLRNISIERTIADLFCRNKDKGLPIISRLGAAHITEIFLSLQKRIKASGGEKELLELDSRAATYDPVAARNYLPFIAGVKNAK